MFSRQLDEYSTIQSKVSKAFMINALRCSFQFPFKPANCFNHRLKKIKLFCRKRVEEVVQSLRKSSGYWRLNSTKVVCFGAKDQ